MSVDKALAAAAQTPVDSLESVYAKIRSGEGSNVQRLSSKEVIEKFGDKMKLRTFVEEHESLLGSIAGDEMRAVIAEKLVEDGILTAEELKGGAKEPQALINAVKTISYNIFGDTLDKMLRHLDATR